MNKIHVLDCTLRDGGYCNQWDFGFANVKKITKGLVDANVDVIECGFLTNQVQYCLESTKFTNVDELSAVIPNNRNGKIFVAMLNYNEYNIDDLPNYSGKSIDGIRVAFHKRDLHASLMLCQAIKKKGYKVFVQAMVSLSYSDREFLDLIYEVNKIEPYAFYIVDSFGMMKSKDLTRLLYIVEHALKDSIWIGFHSHNNLQLAYANAQNLVSIQSNRNLIIDASIFGMGRGAGNLNTELFVDYLNENTGATYKLKPLLAIIDDILNDFYQQNYWGYSLPNYLSAIYSTHPNYAGYLDEKRTLTVESMSEIFELMDEQKKIEYDQGYIEDLYFRYMKRGRIQEEHKKELSGILDGKKIMLIAPGKSSVLEKNKIIEFSKRKDVITISINFDYHYTSVDFIFLSNLRRFRELAEDKRRYCIVTSNIPVDNVYLQTKYHELLNNMNAVKDNAGLMAIKFLMGFNIEMIYLAGFDGYSYDKNNNYVDDHMTFIMKRAMIDAKNQGICNILEESSKKIDIKFITDQHYVHI
jgi:4-hydroxy 2-oxovalerate aldolase